MDIANNYSMCLGTRVAPFLTEDLRRKLIAFGVDLSTITSVSHALRIINKLEKTTPVQDQKDVKDEFFKKQNLSEQEVASRVNSLAQSLGVNVDGVVSPAEKLDALSVKIRALREEKAERSEKDRERIEGYESELAELTQALTSITDKQDSVYSMLDMNASMNKYILGL